MGTLALVWGILAFVGLAIGIIPCLGWMNWVNIPFAVVGVVIAIVALARTRVHAGKGPALVGLVLSMAAVLLGLVRLLLGGGLL